MHIASQAHFAILHLQSLCTDAYRSFQLHIIHLNLTDSFEKSHAIYGKYSNLSNIHVFDAYDLKMKSDVVIVSMNKHRAATVAVADGFRVDRNAMVLMVLKKSKIE